MPGDSPSSNAGFSTPFPFTAWRTWPSASNNQLRPPTWWPHTHAIIHALEPAQQPPSNVQNRGPLTADVLWTALASQVLKVACQFVSPSKPIYNNNTEWLVDSIRAMKDTAVGITPGAGTAAVKAHVSVRDAFDSLRSVGVPAEMKL